MALTPGTRLGVYEITAQIGEGGMGQVWRARDTKLDRDVAIKVLPEAFAHDADRLARFTREAKTLAALNHPHIAAIYGLEESAGVTALVMELVEGDDLSQRIARGAIPIDEALPIAKQIAEALEAAHEQGIIHRDLKPANIKVRADGTVKVLDFGLAKAMDPPVGSSPDVSQSPTITTPAHLRQGYGGQAMTQAGMILGTAAYMAPEQAKGKTVDKRADIWAFGVVFYEMLTGQRLFSAETIPETLAHVMTREIDLGTLPATTPRHIRTLLARCLVKEPKQRLRDIGEARLALAGAFETAAPQVATAEAAAPRGRLAWVAFGAAALVAAALAIPALRYLRQTPPPLPPETRVEIVTPATDRPADFALSPDGRQIVFVASGDGAPRLWLRSLATTTAQVLAGTEGARRPFWSPDGRSIGFFVPGSLKRLDLWGGAPQTLAPAAAGLGGTWSADGVIVFSSGALSGMMRVPATGGPAAAVSTPVVLGSAAPAFLPDGRRFLYFSRGGSPDTAGIYVGALDGSAPVWLTPGDTAAYLSAGPGGAEASREGGWLLWTRAGTLVAQRLDLATAALTGAPVTVADGVTAVSVAATGLVSYRTGATSQRQLVWFNRSATTLGSVGRPEPTGNSLRVSPDGRRVALFRTVQGNEDIWLLDADRMSRFTFDPANERHPVWSPDGTRIVFHSGRAPMGPLSTDLYQKLANGGGVEERVVASDQFKTPTGWSPDGRFLLYQSSDPQTLYDLWVVPMVGAHTPSVFLKTPFSERWGTFSPDGRWVAYQSDESGREEIYVRPFVPPGAAATAAGGQWQVSTAGGAYATWRPDGKELYYLDPAGAMMAAPITVTGNAVVPGTPVVLFPTNVHGGGVSPAGFREYDVASDGRFLINTELDSAAAPITLIQNWNPEAKK